MTLGLEELLERRSEIAQRTTGKDLLREHRYKELWRKYCGFLDLSLPRFMNIQRHLLLEQLELLGNCEMGRKVMAGAQPRTLAEFREQVPLTTYSDYAPYLQEQREEALPAKPLLWQRTSGIWGEHECKWAPMSERMYQEMGSALFAALIFATCKRKYDIRLGDEEKILYALAPPPYATGCWARRADEELPLRFLPPLEDAEEMSFEERVQRGFQQALTEGLDFVFGLPSVLVTLGEQLSQGGQRLNLLSMLGRPRLLMRLAKGLLKSKLARRPLLPKDLWNLRGVAIGGAESSIYRQKIREMWGKDPLDGYGSTEGLLIAVQTWDREGMTFLPNLNFLEFIPEEERLKASLSPGYQSKTCLLNEVTPGQSYELVITNLLGGAFVRYRMGDLVRFTALRNEKLDIDLPQMVFHSRSDGFLDLAGFTRLTERVIGEAIQRSGVVCQEWVARKEGQDSPVLHLYLELKENGSTPDDIGPEAAREAIHYHLKRLDAPYADLEEMLHLKPLRVTILPYGAFHRYAGEQRANGAELSRLAPRRINPSDQEVRILMNGSYPSVTGNGFHMNGNIPTKAE